MVYDGAPVYDRRVMEDEQIRVVSYGGGVQSTALLVLAAQGKIDFPTFLFSNVGDDSEHPATLEFVREIAVPYGREHGIDVIELHRRKKNGEIETLYQRVTKPNHRAITIPLRGQNGAPQSRHCTRDHKVMVIGKWLKQHGATKDNKALVGIGISTDEIERANTKKVEPYEEVTYPLLDFNLRRSDCVQIIKDAGLPVPPKSSCWFCPFHRTNVWLEMRENEPDLFRSACAMEAMILKRQEMLGHPPLYLTPSAMPLEQAIQPGHTQLFKMDDGGDCDSGWCMT